MKTQILDAIGETDLNHSAQISAALAGNERIKYCLSLIQLAVQIIPNMVLTCCGSRAAV